MAVINCVSTGEIASCQDGTLIALVESDGDLNYAVKLKTLDEIVTLAVLRPAGSAGPHISRMHPMNDCVVYGTDWAIEIIHPRDDDKFCGDNFSEKPGAIVVSNDHTFVRLGRDPSDIRSSGAYLDLTSMQFARPGSGFTVTMNKWRVWANAADIDRPGKQPLFSFELTA